MYDPQQNPAPQPNTNAQPHPEPAGGLALSDRAFVLAASACMVITLVAALFNFVPLLALGFIATAALAFTHDREVGD